MSLEMNEIVTELWICIFKIITLFKTLRFEEIVSEGTKWTDSVWYGPMQVSKEVNDKVIMFALYPLLLITVHICVYFAFKIAH